MLFGRMPSSHLVFMKIIVTGGARFIGRNALAATRPFDQPVFVADIRQAARDLGWTPKISPERGTSLPDDCVTSEPSMFGS